jgi:hypothetical protein
MYIRCFRDSIGRIFLQQYIKLESVLKSGKKLPATERWENVPTIGEGQSEAFDLPLGSSCGVMIFECMETIFAGVSEGHKEVKVTYVVSALEVYKITPKEDGIQIFTKDKLALTVKMSYVEFTDMMIGLLNNFKIVRFATDGKLVQG